MGSPRGPLLGILLVWTFYAGFTLLREAPSRPDPGEPAVEAVKAHGDLRAPSPPAPAEEETAPDATVLEPRTTSSDEKAAAEGDAGPPEDLAALGLLLELTPEDEALLEILKLKASGEEGLEKLKAFVAEHPDHALARALLVSYLYAGDIDEAALRPHVEALRSLLPDFGLPDLYMAHLELLAGREDSARRLLLHGAAKDLSWFPDSEVLLLKVSRGLRSGAPPSDVLLEAFSTDMPFCMAARKIAQGFLPGEEKEGAGGEIPHLAAPDPASRAEAARAVFRFGQAWQEQGTVMIQNLIGCSICRQAASEIERCGGLDPREQAMLKRGRAMVGEARVIGSLSQEVFFSSPGILARYVENVFRYGELRAARRGFMEYLAGRAR